MRRVAAFLLLGASLTFTTPAAAPPALPAPEEAALVRQALDQLSRMDYDAAEATLTRGLSHASPARYYFAGLACMNRFLDLGDTIALRRAEGYWTPLTPRGSPPALFKKTDATVLKLYRGLTGIQLSYAASVRGQQVRSTTLALAARPHLEALAAPEDGQGAPRASSPEARASLQLFDYYRERLLSKLPFVDNAEFDEKAYRRAADASPALRDMLLASLFWIHIDRGRFAAAEAVTADFLARYPENRLARQMQASGLYRWGRLDDALEITQALKTEYAKLPAGPGVLPLGYYRAVGNLARIQAARGENRETEALLGEWRKAEKAGLTPWLPSVLKRDLGRL